MARRRYRDTVDGDFDPHKYKEKVRRLIDEHITVLDLTAEGTADPDHRPAVRGSRRRRSPRTARRRRRWSTPCATTSVSTSTKTPCTTSGCRSGSTRSSPGCEDRWEQIALEFAELVRDVNAGRQDEEQTGLDPNTELPFYGVMAERLANSDPDAAERLIATTRNLVADIRTQIAVVGFWHNATKQDALRRSVKRRTRSQQPLRVRRPRRPRRQPRRPGQGQPASAQVTTVHDLDFLAVGDLVFTVAPPTDRKTLQITVDRDAVAHPASTSRASTRACRTVHRIQAQLGVPQARREGRLGRPAGHQAVRRRGGVRLSRSKPSPASRRQRGRSTSRPWPLSNVTQDRHGTGRT